MKLLIPFYGLWYVLKNKQYYFDDVNSFVYYASSFVQAFSVIGLLTAIGSLIKHL